MDYTPDEIIAVCISRQIQDGQLVIQGLATPTVAAGFLLAKLTHAPNLDFSSAIGQSLCWDWAPLGVSNIEELWIKKGKMTVDFVEGACDWLPHYEALMATPITSTLVATPKSHDCAFLEWAVYRI